MATSTPRRGGAASLRLVDGGDPRPHVVVVGAGIAGLAAAWALVSDRSRAPRVTVLEGSSVVGGKLRVSPLAGIDLDEGAESMLATRPEATRLARDVGLGRRIVTPETDYASLWVHPRLRRLPSGLVMGVPTDLRALGASDTVGLAGLLRVPLDHLLPRTPLGDDVAVGPYVAARLGPAVVDRLVEPLLGGVYAGRADELSLRATIPALFRELHDERSLLAAARRVTAAGAAGAGARRGPVFVGVDGGVGALPLAVRDRLAARGVEVRTDATVRRLRRRPQGWRLTVGPARAPEEILADAVVLAVPASPAARLLSDDVPAAAGELAAIDYASVAVVSLAYPATALPMSLGGSGFLVPPSEGRWIKASTFSSVKWGWLARRAAGGRRGSDPVVLLRTSLGRYGEESVLQRDDAELVALSHDDLGAALGLRERPIASRVTRWGGSLPQYAVGHVDRVARVRAAVAEQPGLAVCGAAYDGVGIAAVVGSAREAATWVRRALPAPAQWRHG